MRFGILLHCLIPWSVLGIAQATPIAHTEVAESSIERTPIPQDILIRPLPSAVDSVRDARHTRAVQASEPEAEAQSDASAKPATQVVHQSPEPSGHPRVRPSSRQKRPAAVNPLTHALTQANQAFQTQRYVQVLDLLQPFESQLFNTRDVNAARLQGWAAWHLGDWPLAQRWFTRAANWTNLADDMANVVRVKLAQDNYPAALKQLGFMPDNQASRELRIQAHQSYALHAFKANDHTQTTLQLAALGSLRPLDAGEQEILGWSNYKLEHYEQASQAFEQSLTLNPHNQGAAEGLVFSLNAQNKLGDVFRVSDSLGASTPLAQLTANPLARERLLSRSSNPRVMLDTTAHILPASYVPPAQPNHARTELFVKNSENPFDQGNFRTHGLRLDGLLNGERYHLRAEARVFNAEDDRQRKNGLKDIYLQGRYYDTDGFEWTLGLGSTPQGGVLNPTWRGELGLGWLESEQGGRIRLARRNVEQSVLSTSGDIIPATLNSPAQEWGRVMREGLELDGYRTLGSWKAEGSLGVAQLNGKGVADNRMVEAYVNVLHPVPSLLDRLALGPVIYTTSYQNNLSPFTPGNGGYYSPEKLLRLAAMARYQLLSKGDTGLNLRLDVSAGWQTAHEAAASLDPLAPDITYALSPSDSSGFATTLDLDTHYNVSRNWRYGLLFSGQKSPDYSFLSAHIYLTYLW